MMATDQNMVILPEHYCEPQAETKTRVQDM